MSAPTANGSTGRFRGVRGGPPPFGYMVASGQRVENPEEQRTLTLLLHLVACGANDSQIAGELNVLGARPRHARWWSPQSVRGVRLLVQARRAEVDLAAARDELDRRVSGGAP